jgi:hypothetical protein
MISAPFFQDPGFSDFVNHPRIAQLMTEKNIQFMNVKDFMSNFLMNDPDELVTPRIGARLPLDQAIHDGQVERYKKLPRELFTALNILLMKTCSTKVDPIYTAGVVEKCFEPDSGYEMVFVVKKSVSPVSPKSPGTMFRNMKMKAVLGFCVVFIKPTGSRGDLVAKVDLICSKAHGLSNLMLGLYLHIIKSRPNFVPMGGLEVSDGYNNPSAYCAYRRMRFEVPVDSPSGDTVQMVYMETDLEHETSESIIDLVFQPRAPVEAFCDKSLTNAIIKDEIRKVLVMRFCFLHPSIQIASASKPKMPVDILAPLMSTRYSVLFLLLEPADDRSRHTVFEEYYKDLLQRKGDKVLTLVSYVSIAEQFIKECVLGTVYFTSFLTEKQLAANCDKIIHKITSLTNNPHNFNSLYFQYTGIQASDIVDHDTLQELFLSKNRSAISATMSQTQGALFKRQPIASASVADTVFSDLKLHSGNSPVEAPSKEQCVKVVSTMATRKSRHPRNISSRSAACSKYGKRWVGATVKNLLTELAEESK